MLCGLPSYNSLVVSIYFRHYNSTSKMQFAAYYNILTADCGIIKNQAVNHVLKCLSLPRAVLISNNQFLDCK